MNQVIYLLISFSYGFISGVLYILLNSLFKKNNFIYYLLIFLYFIIITTIYILLFFLINNAEIHLYLKIVLIIGFLTSFKMSTYCKTPSFINKIQTNVKD